MTTETIPLTQDLGAGEWLPVVGFEGFYEVSAIGAVRSLRHSPARIIGQGKDKDGYPIVRLYKDGKRRTVGVHRVVCAAHIGPQPNVLHCEVAHLDGDRTNPSAANLRWVGRVENCSHKKAHGTHSAGEANGFALLTEEMVRAIKQRPSGVSGRALADQYGVSRRTIYDIWIGKTWKHVPGQVSKGSRS